MARRSHVRRSAFWSLFRVTYRDTQVVYAFRPEVKAPAIFDSTIFGSPTKRTRRLLPKPVARGSTPGNDIDSHFHPYIAIGSIFEQAFGKASLEDDELTEPDDETVRGDDSGTRKMTFSYFQEKDVVFKRFFEQLHEADKDEPTTPIEQLHQATQHSASSSTAVSSPSSGCGSFTTFTQSLVPPTGYSMSADGYAQGDYLPKYDDSTEDFDDPFMSVPRPPSEYDVPESQAASSSYEMSEVATVVGYHAPNAAPLVQTYGTESIADVEMASQSEYQPPEDDDDDNETETGSAISEESYLSEYVVQQRRRTLRPR